MEKEDITQKVIGAAYKVYNTLGFGFLESVYPVKQFESKMHYTYVLQSQKDDQFYTGYTTDLKLRFEEHNKGRVKSTMDRIPLKLVYYEACIDRSDATKREKYLKSYLGKMFLRNRLKSYLTG